MKGLLAHFMKPGPDRDQIACQQLALILDALLYGHHPDALFAHALAGQSGQSQQVPSRLIEFSDIPHDIHVAHVIAMPRINRSAICENSVSHDFRYLQTRPTASLLRSGFYRSFWHKSTPAWFLKKQEKE